MSITKDARNGKWMVTVFYTDFSGARRRRRKTGFLTKRDAKEYEETFNRTHTQYDEMTVEEVWQQYKRLIFPELKENTVRSKLAIYKTVIEPYFKNRLLKEIEVREIKEWQQLLRERYTASTQKTFYVTFSALFNFACKYYRFKENPIRLCGSPKRKKSVKEKPAVFWTLDDYNQAMKCENRLLRPRDKAKILIIKLLFWSGLRIGELLALTLNDVLIDQQAIQVNKTLLRSNEFGTPKTDASNRIVSLPDCAWQPLMEYITKYLFKPRKTDRLFMVSYLEITRFLKELCKAMNVPKIHLHSLRHSHASLLVRNGISPVAIKDRLGHASVDMTLNVYSHMYDTDRDDIAKKLNEWNE